MYEHVFEIALTVRAPVLSQATTASSLGVDASAARRDGRVMLPGSLIKGKLKEAWKRLQELAGADWPIGEWLGITSADAAAEDTNAPQRGRMRFYDFTARAEEKGGQRYRVRLDRERGSVDHGALAAVEMPWAPGSKVIFQGQVRMVADGEEAQRARRALAAGLRWVDSVGAYRSLGFGQLLSVAVQASSESVSPASWKPRELTASGRLDLVIRLRDPLLVSRFLPDGNLFECSREIPGAALKGAFAATWREACGHSPSGPIVADLDRDRPELCLYFSQLRFTHAFLGFDESNQRPMAVPLSLVAVGKELWDVALLDGPHLFADEEGRMTAPAFAPDWKHRGGVEKQLGWAPASTETRVRTEIDGATRRGAESRLFAHRSILPAAYRAFYAAVDFGALPQESQAEAARQMQELLRGGLRHLGKTKATADVEPLETVIGSTPRLGEKLRLVLQTPAILADPLKLDESSGRAALHAVYQAAWDELAGKGVLQLERCFARQRLAGGGYLWRRFQADKPYHPFLLTEAGSVFVLKISNPSAADILRDWQLHGLPLPAWAVERYGGRIVEGKKLPGDDWRRCPFIRQNGFGEVALNPDLPWKAPPPERIQPIEEASP